MAALFHFRRGLPQTRKSRQDARCIQIQLCFMVAPKDRKMPSLTMTRVSTKTKRPGVAPTWQSLSVPRLIRTLHDEDCKQEVTSVNRQWPKTWKPKMTSCAVYDQKDGDISKNSLGIRTSFGPRCHGLGLGANIGWRVRAAETFWSCRNHQYILLITSILCVWPMACNSGTI